MSSRESVNSADSDVVDPRPIVRGDGASGVLLLHGLTGTPHEVRPFADALFAAGFAVRAPLLAGHSDIEDLERSTWRDWYGSARAAFEELHDGGTREVLVAGFSMGALLALRLSALEAQRVPGLVAMSTPLRLGRWQRRAIHTLARLRGSTLLHDLVGVLPKFGGPDIRIKREVERSPSLPGFPYPTLAEFIALQDEVADLLPHVVAPTLLMHGRFDHTAPLQQSEQLAQRLGSSHVRLRVLPRSFHVIGLDVDRELACAELVSFAESTLGVPPSSARNPPN